MAEASAPEQSESEVDPLSLFSSEIQTPVEGLMYLGQLTETVHFCGHTFEIKTLRPQDKFAISLVLQPYRNTIHEVDAYQALHVGVAVTAIDGDENYCPAIGPDLEGLVRGRLKYVSENWYPPTIEHIWGRYMLLEATSARAIAELDRLSQRGQPTDSPPWLDSLNALGLSDDETSSDSPPSTPSRSD